MRAVVEVYKQQRSLGGPELQPEQHLGPVKPALLQALYRRFAEAAAEMDGGAGASTSEQRASGRLQPVGGAGKQLPPLAAGGSRLPGLRPRLGPAAGGLEVAGSMLAVPPPAAASSSAPAGAGRGRASASCAAPAPPGGHRPGTGRPKALSAAFAAAAAAGGGGDDGISIHVPAGNSRLGAGPRGGGLGVAASCGSASSRAGGLRTAPHPNLVSASAAAVSLCGGVGVAP